MGTGNLSKPFSIPKANFPTSTAQAAKPAMQGAFGKPIEKEPSESEDDYSEGFDSISQSQNLFNKKLNSPKKKLTERSEEVISEFEEEDLEDDFGDI